ncbi:MAG: hypothetical protein Q9204_008857 [Flavoplaca sp. TL-2023a]
MAPPRPARRVKKTRPGKSQRAHRREDLAQSEAAVIRQEALLAHWVKASDKVSQIGEKVSSPFRSKTRGQSATSPISSHPATSSTTQSKPINNATTAGSVDAAAAPALPAIDRDPFSEDDFFLVDGETDPWQDDGETDPWQDDDETTRGLSAPSPTLDTALRQSPGSSQDADEDLIMLPSGSVPSPFRAHHEPTPTHPSISAHPGPPYSKQAYILDALVILHITQQMTSGNHLYNPWNSVWDPFTKEDAAVAQDVCRLLNEAEKEKLAQHAAHLTDPNNVAFVGRDDSSFLCWLTRFRRGPPSDEDTEHATVVSKAHVRFSPHPAEARGQSATSPVPNTVSGVQLQDDDEGLMTDPTPRTRSSSHPAGGH